MGYLNRRNKEYYILHICFRIRNFGLIAILCPPRGRIDRENLIIHSFLARLDVTIPLHVRGRMEK